MQPPACQCQVANGIQHLVGGEFVRHAQAARVQDVRAVNDDRIVQAAATGEAGGAIDDEQKAAIKTQVPLGRYAREAMVAWLSPGGRGDMTPVRWARRGAQVTFPARAP